MATERKIPTTIVRALSVLMSSVSPTSAVPLCILIMAIATVAPRSSNTSETEVDVGNPNELNTSNRIRFAIITAK